MTRLVRAVKARLETAADGGEYPDYDALIIQTVKASLRGSRVVKGPSDTQIMYSPLLKKDILALANKVLGDLRETFDDVDFALSDTLKDAKGRVRYAEISVSYGANTEGEVSVDRITLDAILGNATFCQ